MTNSTLFLHKTNLSVLLLHAGDAPAYADDEVWRATGKLRTYFAVDIAEPSDPYKETIVTSATLKLYKAVVYPDRIIAEDIVDGSLRINIYQIIDINVGKKRVRGKMLTQGAEFLLVVDGPVKPSRTFYTSMLV